MYTKLTRSERLKDLRVSRNLKIEDVASATGISQATISAYENNEDKDVNLRILQALAKYYQVSVSYIIGETENTTEVLTPIEELHLSDRAIDVLRNAKFNTRLLSEIICHKDFRRLMTDSEIYVDRMAGEAFKNLNRSYELVRRSLVGSHISDPEDLWMQTLQVSQVEETDFFRILIQRDLMNILKDIREGHLDDSTTMDEENSTEALMTDLIDEYKKNGSDTNFAIRAICRVLRIPYDTLPKNFITSFWKVIQSSPLLSTGKKLRGRSRKEPEKLEMKEE